MSPAKKKGRITSGEGFTMGENNSLNLSIGALFREDSGKEDIHSAPLEDQKPEKKKVYSERDANSGISYLSRVSLQRQTAGRGGKTVTAVILPKDAKADRERLAKEMRKGLGCGSFVEGGNVILQGDICDRAREWLIKNGVKEVVSGN
ncbi:MAG: translation initiation factor [Synergistaceae bacterium]|nr:translation initiation factor [Synergistaceae bacterium]